MKTNGIALWASVACFVGAFGAIGACGSGTKNTPPAAGACGNAVVEAGEDCDDGNSNNTDTCDNSCHKVDKGCGVCGNGKVENCEACDAGKDNGVAGSGCTKDCKSDPNCGNGKVDAGEECDEGAMKNSSAPDATCTPSCKKPKCGDGIVQTGECCDDGPPAENMGKCGMDCKSGMNCGSGGAGGTGGAGGGGGFCMGAKTFAKVVSNQTNPQMAGTGLPSVWSYSGLIGAQAGKKMCQDVGADHVCTYTDVVAAEQAGELKNLPTNFTYWLHRATAVPDAKQPNKTCNAPADCGGADDCAGNKCVWKPGAGGRCNDWTYPTDHVSDGEWFRVFQQNDPTNAGGVQTGQLVYHFDADTTYDGTMNHTSNKSETTLGTSGSCGSKQRAILCCFPACP